MVITRWIRSAALSSLLVAGVCGVAGAQAPLTGTAAADPAAEVAPAPAPVARLEAARRALVQEIDAVRQQIDAPGGNPAARSAAETRLEELAQRLEVLEADLVVLRRTPTSPGNGPLDPPGLTPLDVSMQEKTSQVTSGREFNPAISVIPDALYYADSRQGEAAAIMDGADGFHVHGGETGGHTHGSGIERGFNLRELEVAFSGAVDPYFDVWTVLAIGGGEVEAEEAYIQTRRLLPGLQLRVGKFYSAIGYINRQHPHQWDFVDQALPYDLLLGGALNETGVQATYLPNLPVFLQVGFEALQGQNERVANQIGGETAPFLDEKAGPRLLTGFARIAPDLGYSSALQMGFSVGHARLHQELHDEDEDGVVDEAYQGTSTVWGADAVYKYDSGKRYGTGDLTIQGEYLRRIRSLDLVAADAGPLGPGGPIVRFVQDGLYAQAVYGFWPRWTAGLRLDVVGLTNHVDGEIGPVGFDSSRRYTVSLTFNPTEFSRVRAQYGRGDIAVAGGRQACTQVWVQVQVSLGAHGAHAF